MERQLREHHVDIAAMQTFVTTTLVAVALKVLAAIALWIVGRWLIGRVILVMQAAMNRNQVDHTLTKYLGSERPARQLRSRRLHADPAAV
jgi:small conductance mechanosensitive channel